MFEEHDSRCRLTRIASVAQRVNINPPPGTVQGKITSRILAVEQQGIRKPVH